MPSTADIAWIVAGSEPPTSPKFGDVWLDTSDSSREARVMMWDNKRWNTVQRAAETEEVGTWEENVEYLLSRCPYTIRVCEGGGPENLISSLIVTFMKMEIEIAKLKGKKS